jgi:hypothetical protein
MPRVSILDPSPARAAEKFHHDFGISGEKLVVYPKPFSREFNLAEILE